MTKVISLSSYCSKKKPNKLSPYGSLVWFKELSEGIQALATQDRELIFKNIKYNYFNEYVHYVNTQALDSNYSFIDYLKGFVNVNEPFKVYHGVDFHGEQSRSRLSQNDWRNIADIIVRISLISTLDSSSRKVDPAFLAAQYSWEQVQMDVLYE